MQWEQLTSFDFAKAVQASQGVGIIPVGVIESHASHLPLGTDLYTSHYAACEAAKQKQPSSSPNIPIRSTTKRPTYRAAWSSKEKSPSPYSKTFVMKCIAIESTRLF